VREGDDAPSATTAETVESDAEEVVEAPQASSSADDSPAV
ncbi:MAG: hypothetical protein QOG02_1166, partial [Gaiellales bacterium]|nr:hypothetical protein [Gaiellales bacterium]